MRASWRRLLFFFVCIAIGVGADRGAAFGDPERARRAGARDAGAHRRRHPGHQQPAVRASRCATRSPREQAGGPGQQTCPRPSRSPRWSGRRTRAASGDQDGGAAGRAAVVSVLRHADAARGHLLATRCWRGAARWCGRNCWRSSTCASAIALLIGTQTFEIRGVIATEPGRSLGAFSLGPAGPDRPRRSAGDRSARLRQPRQLPAAAARRPAATVRDAGREPARPRSPTSSFAPAATGRTQDRIGENLSRAENYLSLVGLVDPDPRRHRRVERHPRLRRSRRSAASPS